MGIEAEALPPQELRLTRPGLHSLQDHRGRGEGAGGAHQGCERQHEPLHAAIAELLNTLTKRSVLTKKWITGSSSGAENQNHPGGGPHKDLQHLQQQRWCRQRGLPHVQDGAIQIAMPFCSCGDLEPCFGFCSKHTVAQRKLFHHKGKASACVCRSAKLSRSGRSDLTNWIAGARRCRSLRCGAPFFKRGQFPAMKVPRAGPSSLSSKVLPHAAFGP